MSLLHGTTRMQSDDSRRAREMREQASEDRLFRALRIKRNEGLDVTEFDYDGDRKLAVEIRRNQLIKLGEMDRFVVIHKGLRHIRLLFYSADYHSWWIVERDLFRDELRKSMVYGSRDQAMTASQLDYVEWI